MRSGVLLAGAFLQEDLKLSDDLQVLWAAGGSLYGYQAFESQTPALDAKDPNRHAVRLKILIRPPTDDFPKEVEIADIGCQREVQASLDSSGFPTER